MSVVVLALPGFESLLPEGRGQVGGIHVERFPNRELSLRVEARVDGEACVLLGSVAPPDEQMLSLSLAADTLKRHGAARVTALLPYLAYARQDKQEPAGGLGIAWVGKLLSACGVDALITIDIHSRRAAALMELPVVSRRRPTSLPASSSGWGSSMPRSSPPTRERWSAAERWPRQPASASPSPT